MLATKPHVCKDEKGQYVIDKLLGVPINAMMLANAFTIFVSNHRSTTLTYGKNSVQKADELFWTTSLALTTNTTN